MKKNGFTIIELLGCLALLGIVLLIGIHSSKDGISTSLAKLRVVTDNEVFTAAESYVLGENISFSRSGYVCVKVKDLIDYGYLKQTNDEEVQKKTVKLSRNNKTKVIENVKYVDRCN